VSATVQLARSSDTGADARNQAQLWAAASASVIVLLCLIWWASWHQDAILKIVHPYRVTRINLAEGTMDLVHGNRSYVVHCAEHCRNFTVGGFYGMKDAGAVLQHSQAGQVISFPIVEEETTFDVTGGHG
jgi:hypothetical protein